jgi:hypothetical protein
MQLRGAAKRRNGCDLRRLRWLRLRLCFVGLLLVGCASGSGLQNSGSAGSGSEGSGSEGSGSEGSGSEGVNRPEWAGDRLPSVAFVVACELSHEANDDPIVHPGHPGASHRHAFFGARTTGAVLSVDALQAGGTSCAEPLDTAAYWTPAPVGVNMRAYYDLGDAAIDDVMPYPAGMSAVTGDPLVASPGISIAGFRCGVLGDGPDAGQWSARPPAGCSVGMVLVRYSFGQCGVDRLVVCATNEPARWPRLRLLFEWKGGGGLGPHADFVNAWDPARLASLVGVCIRGERLTNLEIKQCNLPGAT